MKKVFILKLKSLEYLGDAIGNDIILEIQIGDQSSKIKLKIDHGDTLEINQGIGYFETEENYLELPTRITIIEKDILFDDVGYAEGMTKIDLAARLSKSQSFEIKVNEKRGVLSKRVAVFRAIIEAAPAIRFVKDVDQQSWLMVRSQDDSKDFAIPLYLKVQIDSKDEGREYFTILEGVHKNTKASVSIKEDGTSRFKKINPHKKGAYLTYSISKKTLRLGRKVYKTIDYAEAPWARGIYDIEIPDYPHKLGSRYTNIALRATTWFHVNYGEDRYIHTGGRSLGCITLTETNRWDELCFILISARKGDNRCVGVLTVVD